MPPAIRCSPPTWRPTGSSSKPRRDCRARMCRSSSTTPAKASFRSATDRLKALGYTDIRQLDGGLQAWRKAGYELFQDVNSYAKAFGELVESRRHTPSLPADEVAALMASKANISHSRCSAVRRICDHEHPRLRQRARRGTGAARRQRRAGSRDDHHRELCRPHPIDHRHPVAHQRRRREQGAGAAKRDDRLDARKAETSSMARTGAAGSASSRARRANAREVAYRAGVRHVGPDEAMALAGADPPHALSLRRPRGRRICGRSHPRLSPLSGRATRPGDRHGGAGARGAHPPDRRYAASAPT